MNFDILRGHTGIYLVTHGEAFVKAFQKKEDAEDYVRAMVQKAARREAFYGQR